MALQHVCVQDSTQGSSTTPPTLVVDGMACLRDWYGGQWKELMHCLEEFVDAFTNAGI
jgi:hypothetical protein